MKESYLSNIKRGASPFPPLALLFAIGIGLGTTFWGKKVKKGRVLFISTEDGAVRLKKRIWKMVNNPAKYQPNFHFYIGDCVLTDKKVYEALRLKTLELKPNLIVLDPLINLFRKRELNSGEDMNEILRPLQTLAKESGATVLVIHHARKSAGDDPIDVIQGSITISGVADGLLILKNLKSEEEAKRATLEVILKDADIPKTVVLKLDETLRWEVEGELEEVIKKSIDDEIMRVLKETPEGLTIYDLERITGYSYKQLYQCLVKLEGDKVDSKPVGKSHKKIYFPLSRRESEGKAKESSDPWDVEAVTP